MVALRCLYRHAEDDGLITEAGNPACKVAKPRRLPCSPTFFRHAIRGTPVCGCLECTEFLSIRTALQDASLTSSEAIRLPALTERSVRPALIPGVGASVSAPGSVSNNRPDPECDWERPDRAEHLDLCRTLTQVRR